MFIAYLNKNRKKLISALWNIKEKMSCVTFRIARVRRYVIRRFVTTIIREKKKTEKISVEKVERRKRAVFYCCVCKISLLISNLFSLNLNGSVYFYVRIYMFLWCYRDSSFIRRNKKVIDLGGIK